MHAEPKRGLAVGLGIGSTAYSLAQHPSLEHVDCVEICGGEKRLIARLGERGSPTSRRLVEDPRVSLIDGDGRRFLLAGGEPYDVIVVDAVRPNTAYAGNLYSIEFYEMVKSRLAPGGLFVQWVPTGRVLNSVMRGLPSRLDHRRARVLRLLVPGRERGAGSISTATRSAPASRPSISRPPSAPTRSSGCAPSSTR